MTIDEIKDLIDDTIDTNITKYPSARKVRAINKAQDTLVNLILEKDTLSQYDDANYTDLAEGYMNLETTRTEYNIREDENFADLLAVVNVFVKDRNGEFKLLKKVASNDPKADKQVRDVSSNNGTPTSYRLSGMKIILNETPNYSTTGGIKILFIRIPTAVLLTDTTKELGIPSTFHPLVAIMAAYDYAVAKDLKSKTDIEKQIVEGKIRLGLHVSRQDKDADHHMTSWASLPQNSNK